MVLSYEALFQDFDGTSEFIRHVYIKLPIYTVSILTKLRFIFLVAIVCENVRVTQIHLGLKLQALCAPLLVSSFNSRGAPRRTGVRDLC
jgi:hypothetical protein